MDFRILIQMLQFSCGSFGVHFRLIRLPYTVPRHYGGVCMKIRFITLTAVFALSLLPAIASAGHSRGYGYQSWPAKYAEIAVRQSREARQLSCHFRGSRWTRSYEKHYYWASRQSRYQAEHEIRARQAELDRCRRWQKDYYYDGRKHGRHGRDYDGDHRYGRSGRSSGHHYSGFAEDYARTAVAQTRRSYELNCGYRGSRWSTDYYDHHRWALKAGSYKAMREIEARQHELEQCRYRRG